MKGHHHFPLSALTVPQTPLLLSVVWLACCMHETTPPEKKHTMLEWGSVGSLEICLGNSISVDVTKIIADTVTNRWLDPIKHYSKISIQIEDSTIVALNQQLRIQGSRVGSTVVRVIDTVDDVKSPYKIANVINCD